MSKKFRIIKSFNNNVVFCIDLESNKECILLGSGVGFGARENQTLKNTDKIEKIFYLVDEKNMFKFAGLSKEIDKDIIGITEEVILMASKELNKDFDERIHITLLDHIAFTIDRFKNNMAIVNPFLAEIKSLYKAEYIASLKGLRLINERLNIELPEDEVGFIAMHIHAAINKVDVSKTAQSTTIINEVILFLEEKTGKEIDKESIDYVRLITHVRFALDRVEKKIPIKNILLSDIREKFKESYSLATEIANEIEQSFKIKLPEDEIGYLAIHIENIASNIFNKNS
ncbi:PRD domain-containing protein [Clostridium swellfunianum]|uniref:PRD domain-containing protein n=1 Tax=Clostridium swellfunianum TaxID=1367462 RepID=UPI002030F5F0|nr:PRD domain-containing protein [Clostridium swellfunianum]MCM0649185.1 PRD domain-containing protein [Clostridium swellfunianum]